MNRLFPPWIALAAATLVLLVQPLQSAVGQDAATYSYTWRGAPLQQVLDMLAAETRLDIVFTSERVSGRFVYCSMANASARDLLQCALDSVEMDFVVSSSGAYIVIDPIELPRLVGQLAGRVVDAESGVPLADANVLLEDAVTGIATNHDGLFAFTSLIAGWHDVTVTYVGYAPTLSRVLVQAGIPARVEIQLQPATQRFEPVVVDGLLERFPSEGLGSDPALAESNALHGPDKTDFLRGATLLPGVAAHRPVAELHIQGSPSSEHLTLLDGAPIRDPVSLGRHMSAFSPLALRRVTVEKAGFGASGGSHLAGVVRVEHNLHGGGPPEFALLADPASLNGRMSGTTRVGGRKINVMAAARRSAWDLYHAPSVDALINDWNVVDPLTWSLWSAYQSATNYGELIGYDIVDRTPDVGFSDLHLASRLDLGPFAALSVSGYRANNRVSSDLLSLLELEPKLDVVSLTRDTYHWTNWAGQANYTGLVGDRAILEGSVSASSHSSSIGYANRVGPTTDPLTPEIIDSIADALRDSIAYTRGAYEDHRIDEVSAQIGVEYSASPSVNVDASVSGKWSDARFSTANQFVDAIGSKVDGLDLGGHVSASIRRGLRWQFEPGIRLTYVSNTRRVFIEPRMAVRFDGLPRSWGSYAIRIAGGVYRQFVQQYEISSGGATAIVPGIRFWLPVDGTVTPPRSYHVALEALLLPSGPLTYRGEVYYKAQPHLLELDFAYLTREGDREEIPLDTPQGTFVGSSNGTAIGAGLRIQYERRGLRGSGSYDWSHSKRTFPGRFEGRQVTVPWNEPHRLTLAVSIPVDRHLAISGTWQSSWGRTWAYRHSYYDYLSQSSSADDDAPAFATPERDTGTNYRQFDVGASYTLETSRFRTEIHVGVQNVLNRANIFDYGVESPDAGARTLPRRLPGRQPTFAVKIVV